MCVTPWVSLHSSRQVPTRCVGKGREGTGSKASRDWGGAGQHGQREDSRLSLPAGR